MGDTTDDLITLANGITKDPYQYAREMDMLLTTGEQVSIALLAMAFKSLGQPAISLTGPMAGMRTDSVHTKGRIKDIQPKRVHEELDKAGNIVVVAGFGALTEIGDLVTLAGRGSDTSAVALAGALKADSWRYHTDIDGVYSADPRIVKNARKMKRRLRIARCSRWRASALASCSRVPSRWASTSTFRFTFVRRSRTNRARRLGRIIRWKIRIL